MSTLKPVLISITVLLTFLESSYGSTGVPAATTSSPPSETTVHSDDPCENVDIHVSEDGMEINVTLLQVTAATCDYTKLQVECDGDVVCWDPDDLTFKLLNRQYHPGLLSCNHSINITNSSFVGCSFGLVITDMPGVDPCGNLSANLCKLPRDFETGQKISYGTVTQPSLDVTPPVTENLTTTISTADTDNSDTLADEKSKTSYEIGGIVGGIVGGIGVLILLLLLVIGVCYKYKYKKEKENLKLTPQKHLTRSHVNSTGDISFSYPEIESPAQPVEPEAVSFSSDSGNASIRGIGDTPTLYHEDGPYGVSAEIDGPRLRQRRNVNAIQENRTNRGDDYPCQDSSSESDSERNS